MSKAGSYLSDAKKVLAILEGEKPHSSITDWIEILTSDRYTEDSLDGVAELNESIRLQSTQGVLESSRALRKKLKYGNVHRQLRALTLLRALSENGTSHYKSTWANHQLLERLRDMATDSLTDPKVKRKLISCFHVWSLAYANDARNAELAGMYNRYSGKKVAPRPVAAATSTPAATATTTSKPRSSGFEDLDHTWAPSNRGADTYADLAAEKEKAAARQRERDAQSALEMREAEIERRERALKNKDAERMRLEDQKRKNAEEEIRRRKLRDLEAREREVARREREKNAKNQPKRPPFDFAKERPQVLVSIANASQAASNLVNACRHVNREKENLTENVNVQDRLEQAKVARRPIIRYIQLVNDEEFVGVLIEANEKIVEAIQLYDKMSKPAELDSDDEDDEHSATTAATAAPTATAAAASTSPTSPGSKRDMDSLSRRMEAQRLEADRTGELHRLQAKQKWEVEKSRMKRENSYRSGGGTSRLPPPMSPDEDYDDARHGSLSDFSDYDSSDSEYQARHRSANASRRQSLSAAASSSSKLPPATSYAALDEDEDVGGGSGRAGLLDPNDPFADPTDFLGSIGGGGGSSSKKPKERMEWAAI